MRPAQSQGDPYAEPSQTLQQRAHQSKTEKTGESRSCDGAAQRRGVSGPRFREFGPGPAETEEEHAGRIDGDDELGADTAEAEVRGAGGPGLRRGSHRAGR